MAVIHVLDKHTAELIAAGEVVERPASVVKELLENAIDAGATQVTVSIESGGIKLIEVSDNGSGIEPEDIPTAFIRHATSKISTESDLNSIHTLGFRGEALASIASVARVELLTCTPSAEYASSYRIEGGEELGIAPGARGVGTTIRVRDLFYNTPARMKFLKKDSSEGTFVADLVGHVALSRPDVQFRFVREGKLQFVTPGDGQLRGAVYAVLGREFARDLLEVDDASGPYRLRGLVTLPRSCRASRSMQYFYINGRYVRNRTMMAGLEAAFKGTTMQGKFPGAVLMLEMPPELVDVNVHPAKTEIRFAHENDVFDVVYHAVKLALAQPGSGERRFSFAPQQKENKTETARLASEKITEKLETNELKTKNAEKQENFTGLSAVIPGQSEPGALKPAAVKPAAKTCAAKPAAEHSFEPKKSSVLLRDSAAESSSFRRAGSEFLLDIQPELPEEPQLKDAFGTWAEPRPLEKAEEPLELPKEEEDKAAAAIAADPAPCRPSLPQDAAESEPGKIPSAKPAPGPAPQKEQAAAQPVEPEQTVLPGTEEPRRLKYVGEVFRTYIIAQQGEELCFIDKHAAHERQLYEKLSADYGSVDSQMLLTPQVVDLSAEEKQAVLENLPLLENAGIEVSDFGGCSLLLRAVPVDVEPAHAEDLLVELADKLARGSRDALSERTEWVLHSIACRAAIKAGDHTSAQELMALAEKILSGKVPPFCPHGRPCVLKLTRKELEKQFGRIV